MLLALALSINACADPPTDDELIKHFNRHRDDIEELADFIHEKVGSGWIGLNYINASHGLNRHPELLRQLRAAMKALDIEQIQVPHTGSCIYLDMDRRGKGGFLDTRIRGDFHIKGYANCRKGDPSVKRVRDTDIFFRGYIGKRYVEVFRHIEPGWYVHHFLD